MNRKWKLEGKRQTLSQKSAAFFGHKAEILQPTNPIFSSFNKA